MASLTRVLSSLLVAAALAAGARSGTFVYVHDHGDDEGLLAFALDPKTGALTPLVGSPFAGSSGDPANFGHVRTLCWIPSSKVLVSSSPLGLDAWDVAADGTPALVAGSPFGGTSFGSVAAVKRGARTFVYAADVTAGSLRVFELQPDGHALVELPELVVGDLSNVGPLAASKKLLFATLGGGASLAAFAVQPDGALVAAPGSPFDAGVADGTAPCVTPSGAFLHVGDDDSGDIATFRVDKQTGALTATFPAEVDSGLAKVSGALDGGKGKLVFALHGTVPGAANDVVVLKRGAGGALAPLTGPQQTGLDGFDTHATDTKGRILVGVNGAGDDILTFLVDPKTGQLSLADSDTVNGANATMALVVKR